MSNAAGYTLLLVLLAALVGAALLLAARRRGPGLLRREGSLRVLESLALGPRERVLLLECQGRRFLVGQGAQGLVLLARVGRGRAAAPPETQR